MLNKILSSELNGFLNIFRWQKYVISVRIKYNPQWFNQSLMVSDMYENTRNI